MTQTKSYQISSEKKKVLSTALFIICPAAVVLALIVQSGPLIISTVIVSLIIIPIAIIFSKKLSYKYVVNENNISVVSDSGKVSTSVDLKSIAKIDLWFAPRVRFGYGPALLIEDSNRKQIMLDIFTPGVLKDQAELHSFCKDLASKNLSVTTAVAKEKLGIITGNNEMAKLQSQSRAGLIRFLLPMFLVGLLLTILILVLI